MGAGAGAGAGGAPPLEAKLRVLGDIEDAVRPPLPESDFTSHSSR